MHISLSLSLPLHLLLTLPLALAFASTPAAPNPIATPTPPGQQLYHLKTRAIGNSSATNSTKDGLYVMAYHNGIPPSALPASANMSTTLPPLN